jgi:uncharacterized membrane protein
MVEILLIILISSIVAASGQLFVKKGLLQIGEIEIANIKTAIFQGINVATNKFVILGLLCSAIAAVLGFIVLSRMELSMLSPISLGLFSIFIALFSWLILKETMNPSKIAGIIIIIIGIVVLSR